MIIKKFKNKKRNKPNCFIIMALKIIFMGTPDFAVPILKLYLSLIIKFLMAYTQNPKKKIDNK